MSGEVEIAREIARTRRNALDQARASQAAFRSVEAYQGDQKYYGIDGVEIARTTVDVTTGTLIVQHNIGGVSAPPIPTEPEVEAIEGGFAITWDGTFVDGNWTEAVQAVEIHVLPDEYVITTTATQVGAFSTSKGGVFIYTLDSLALRTIRLQTVGISGAESSVSSPVTLSALPRVTAGEFGEVSDLVEGWRYGGTEYLSGDAVAMGSTPADRIDEATYDGVTITGSVIQTADPAGGNEALVMRNDGSGGILETFSGFAGETPGAFNPSGRSYLGGAVTPSVQIYPGKVPAFPRRPMLLLQAVGVSPGDDRLNDDAGGAVVISADFLSAYISEFLTLSTEKQTDIFGREDAWLHSEQIATLSAGPEDEILDGFQVLPGEVRLITSGDILITDSDGDTWDLIARIARSLWQTPTYNSNWGTWTDDNNRERHLFRVIHGNELEIIGRAKRSGSGSSGAVGDYVFQLPEQFRPDRTVERVGVANGAPVVWTIQGSATADAGKVWCSVSVPAGAAVSFGFTLPLSAA